MAGDSESEGTGYGRPPKHSQFKKGHSGNPQGRARRPPSFKSDLAAELQEKLVINENGKPRKVTKQRALVKTLMAAAIKKDIRAVSALLGCIRHFGVDVEEKTPERVDVEDLDLIETFVRQQRKQRDQINSEEMTTKSSKTKTK